MMMNRFLCLAILMAVVFCVPVSSADELSVYVKIVKIRLNYQGGTYTASSPEITYGQAPNLNLRSGELEGAILGADGKELQSFTIRQPGVAAGDILGPPGKDSLTGFSEQAAVGELVIVIPFIDGMQTFTLTDSRDGSLLVMTDLDEPVNGFCLDYPQDPQCLVRIPAIHTGTPDAGTQLVIAAIFAVLGLLVAGIPVWIIRRWTAAVVTTTEEISRKNTVLIVDDAPYIVDMIDKTLNRRGMDTLKAFSGEECLDILKNHVPDVILLDVMMGPMNGWETLEEIKKTPDHRDIPVLMLTGSHLTSSEAKKYGICIHDYLMKPFNPHELNAAVDHVLDRRMKFKESLARVRQAGVEQEKFCELVQLTRHTYVNQKLVEVLNIQKPTPETADPDKVDEMLVVDYLKARTRSNEKRVAELRKEINSAFRQKGLPDIPW